MKVLVIGKGGREHAIVKALSLSSEVEEVHVVPGNAGMREAICHQLSTLDGKALLQLVTQKAIDYVIIGPEAELVDGLADVFRSKNIPVVGPSKEASLLEGSKIFSKEFMNRAEVPTARSVVVSSLQEIRDAVDKFSAPYILKADGLAAGKGVFICKNQDELLEAGQSLFEDRILGDAGSQALLEEGLEGWELSVLCLTDGVNYEVLPLSQDHKRLGEHQTGPNTGGMGTLAPLHISDELSKEIEEEIIRKSVNRIRDEGFLFRGVLFIGVMVTPDGPKVLEYNVRFGDPETQVVLPLLDGDWGAVFKQLASGHLPKLEWKPICTACVVLAAEGYPSAPVRGAKIQGDITKSSNSSYFLHAGTAQDKEGMWITQGGRVLNAVGVGSSFDECIKNAYQQAKSVTWPGLQMRTDIGSSIQAEE